ncbi:MBL fold metallo-hydrolase [Candidatus Peregrinibacteria bacterium]|nr:MAG: MBL fold metallo-hydrolase [Candidatus Peregrinibacteria bacterium]
MFESFGGKPDANSLKKIHQSKQFKKGRFRNKQTTVLRPSLKMIFRLMRDYWQDSRSKRVPKQIIDNRALKKQAIQKSNDSITWLGHSTLIIKLQGEIIATDPIVADKKIGPFSWLGIKSFRYKHRYQINELPSSIDAVLISHDHYDHLDMPTIKKIHSRVKNFLVPLGVKAHLVEWGVPSEKIHEFDWHESVQIGPIKYTATPSQHFSGRSLTDSACTLWASWVIETKKNRLFYSGDTGYSKHFKEIGKQYGPFDLAFIECGAYSRNWSDVHMFPKESVQACIDLKCKTMIPIHWGKYNLAFHGWLEPVQIAEAASQQNKINLLTPLMGETLALNQKPATNEWWKKLIN